MFDQQNTYGQPQMPGMQGQGMPQGMPQGGQQGPSPYASQSQMPPSGFGQPQTDSYAHGGRTRKRHSMVEVYVSKPEIQEMIEAQGGPEFDKLTGRHVFKKLSRFMENPHVERAIRARFANGGGMSAVPQGMQDAMGGMPARSFAHGGHAITHRSPMGEERYARGGDTDLVYITPHMKRIFDETGRGSINPVNGKPEYFGLSDIWGGIKSFGQGALGALNSAAPTIAEALKPMAGKLPGAYGVMANAALDAAPNLLNKFNNYVSGQNNPDPTAGPDWGKVAPEFGAHVVNEAAGRFNNPLARGAQAGAQSYLNNQSFGQGMGNAMNAATSGMGDNPMTDIMRRGTNELSGSGNFEDAAMAAGNRAVSYLPQAGQYMQQNAQRMGNQLFKRMPGRMQSVLGPMVGAPGAAPGQGMPATNTNRQQAESQALDQIYRQPSYA